MSIWDNCNPNNDQIFCLKEIEEIIKSSRTLSSSSSSAPPLSSSALSSSTPALSLNSNSSSLVSLSSTTSTSLSHSIQSLKHSTAFETFSSLTGIEQTCSTFITSLDEILIVLDEVSQSHEEITSRTNVLMMNCESLLEQQHNLNEVVESLRNILQPFNDIEDVASLLGIPIDPTGKPSKHLDQLSSSSSIDPRSNEFREILSRISQALTYLHTHPQIKDSERYLLWLIQLQKRADSLISKSMIDLLNSARQVCKEEYIHSKRDANIHASTRTVSDSSIIAATNVPLESMSLYTRFRGLGFRMRELSEMLKQSERSSEYYYHLSIANTLSTGSQKNTGKNTQSSNSQYSNGRKAFSSNDFESQQKFFPMNSPTTQGSSGGHGGNFESSVLNEVLHSYHVIRWELLQPVLSDYLQSITQEAFGQIPPSAPSPRVHTISSPNSSHSSSFLCSVIRNSYGILFRTAQLEQQLYLSLYRSTVGEESPHSTSAHSSKSQVSGAHHITVSTSSSDVVEIENYSHLVEIISEISSQISGHLRTLLIKETCVESLCRVIHTLTQDVMSQLEGTRIYSALYERLEEHLLRTTSDARERLVHCSEVTLRQQVQMFEPLPSQLAYPEILEKAINLAETESSTDTGAMSATWYPPLKSTLALLSLLYGAVNAPIFEDLARRSITLCIQSLSSGATGVKRWKNQMHGDLFLTRHLLILREQLMPFNMNLQSIEKHLDFTTTGTALTSFVSNSMSLLRFDATNTIFQMARDGLPGMNELNIDIKKYMDETLKSSCQSLKYSAVQFLLGPLEGFLAKVTAFIGSDIPVYRGHQDDPDDQSVNGQEALIPSNHRDSLKKQQFVKVDRIQSVLTTVIQTCLEAKPQFAAMVKLYIDNPVTRAVILKPVVHELQIAKLRMGTVIASCVDPGQPRRDLENLLRTITFSLSQFESL